MEIKPCVGANNTLSLPSPPLPSSKLTPIPSFNEDSKIPLMKLLIKLLHFFSLSTPFFNETQKGTQQQEKRSTKDDDRFSVLPPFAYTTAMIFFFQLFSVIFVLNIEEFSSPLVMFSYWRNKIS
jgi:hypothetical protein